MKPVFDLIIFKWKTICSFTTSLRPTLNYESVHYHQAVPQLHNMNRQRGHVILMFMLKLPPLIACLSILLRDSVDCQNGWRYKNHYSTICFDSYTVSQSVWGAAQHRIIRSLHKLNLQTCNEFFTPLSCAIVFCRRSSPFAFLCLLSPKGSQRISLHRISSVIVTRFTCREMRRKEYFDGT